MIKYTFLLICLLYLLSACDRRAAPKVWTEEYEQNFYNYLDSVTKASVPDDKKRAKFIKYVIRRVKQEVPNGFSSISKDSLQSLNIIIGREYALKEYNTGNADVTPTYTPWSPLIERTFRDNYVAISKNKYPATINNFCDCVIKKLKIEYPDSIIIPIPSDINLKVNKECSGVLIGKDAQ